MANERFVVADGHIDSGPSIDAAKYVFQFSSHMFLCGNDVGSDEREPPRSFFNNVKCRKWTDLSGNTFNTPCLVGGPEPPQPDKGCIVNVGDVTLFIRNAPQPRRIVCNDFKLEGTLTYGTEVLLETFVVFLFEGEGPGKSRGINATSGGDNVTVKGVGTCLETLNPNGPPKVESWKFVFTIC